MENCVEIKNISKKYQGFSLDNVSFNVPYGSVVGFIGENGAGKSTTIKAVLGLVKPNSGTITVLGENANNLSADVKEKIGVVFDGLCFPPFLNAVQLDKVLGGIYKTWNSKKFFSYLQKFDIPTNNAFFIGMINVIFSLFPACIFSSIIPKEMEENLKIRFTNYTLSAISRKSFVLTELAKNIIFTIIRLILSFSIYIVACLINPILHDALSVRVLIIFSAYIGFINWISLPLVMKFKNAEKGEVTTMLITLIPFVFFFRNRINITDTDMILELFTGKYLLLVLFGIDAAIYILIFGILMLMLREGAD